MYIQNLNDLEIKQFNLYICVITPITKLFPPSQTYFISKLATHGGHSKPAELIAPVDMTTRL